MIKNFSDHSANERTFLAWVRTAIAVMAFGFIVEKFDLFLEVAAPSLAGRRAPSRPVLHRPIRALPRPPAAPGAGMAVAMGPARWPGPRLRGLRGSAATAVRPA